MVFLGNYNNEMFELIVGNYFHDVSPHYFRASDGDVAYRWAEAERARGEQRE